jgi:hypothetical protein
VLGTENGASEGIRIMGWVADVDGSWRTSTAYVGHGFWHFRHCPPASASFSSLNVTKIAQFARCSLLQSGRVVLNDN